MDPGGPGPGLTLTNLARLRTRYRVGDGRADRLTRRLRPPRGEGSGYRYRDVYGLDPSTQPVDAAVHVSTAIPGFFVPVPLRSSLTEETSLVVDGGVSDGFPVTPGAAPRGAGSCPHVSSPTQCGD